MTSSLPNFIVYKTGQQMKPFVHPRSDGRRVIFGFTSREKAFQFLKAAGLIDEWEPAPMDPQSLRAWLKTGPDAEVLALDAADPSGEFQAVEVERAIRAIDSQNLDQPVQVEYQPQPAER